MLILSACGVGQPAPCLGISSLCDAPGIDGGSASDAGVADAGISDAGVDGGFVDWREVRGAPFALRDLGTFVGAPFSVRDDGFALATACDGGACDYEWRSDDGGVTARQPNLSGVASGFVSRSGALASALRIDTRGTCTHDGLTSARFDGQWALVDAFTGATLHQEAVTTSDFLDQSFTNEGGYARFNVMEPRTCGVVSVQLRETRAPYATPPVLDGEPLTTWVEAELRDGRMLLSRPPQSLELAFVDKRAVPTMVSSAVMASGVDGDFVHVFEGWPHRELVSADVTTGRVRRTTLPHTQTDWFAEPTAHRYALFTSHAQQNGRRPLLFVDGRGEHPQRQVIAGRFEGRRSIAVAPRADFAVYFDADAEVMRRLDLVTGVSDALDAPPGVLREVGDGLGVVIASREELWVLGTGVHARVPGRPLAVVDAVSMGGAKSLVQNQTALLLTTSESGGEVWLTAWHVPSGRLVRLTDALFYNEPYRAPAAVAARCDAPGFVRSAGAPVESTLQDAAWLHFTEFVPAAQPRQRLFVVPVDLSASPRLLADVPSGECGTPLRAPGGRFWVPVPVGEDSVRALMTE